MTTKRRRGGTTLFELRHSSIHGLGAFALREIPAGTRIAEYTGERITQDEADARYDDDSMEHHHTFLFKLDDDTLLDATRRGNASRFINHSCEPNCESVTEDGHIYIDAIKDIAADEELTYDYRIVRAGRYQKSWDTLYACRCGAPSCRGTMLAPRRRRARRADAS